MIRLLLTGGTIDKTYDEINGVLNFPHTNIEQMLKISRSYVPVEVTKLFLKDSLDLNDHDRKTVVDACTAAVEDKIIITHGTDTMTQTAAEIFKANIQGKVIVLTGSLVPFSFGPNSDALFNLGTALAFAQILKPGVYIAMNGQYFSADQVHKDNNLGIFKPN